MSVTAHAIERLRQMVVSGELKSGDRLPPEKPLAAQLGLSRSSLREAVRALSVAGLLRVRRGDGTYVMNLASADDLGFLGEVTRDRGILEVYELRRILEPEATAMCAGRANRDTLRALRAAMKAMEQSATVEEHVAADVEFHSTVANGCGNGTLAAVLETLWPRTARARVWQGVSQEGALERTREEHRAILRAIEAHDPERARAAARLHLAEGEEWLRTSIGLS